MVKNILIVNGSYRDDGITDRATEIIGGYLVSEGAHVKTIMLRDVDIDFCFNCRECMQKPGDAPEPCVQKDAMGQIVEKIEGADAFVLAAPTNLGSVTAIFKRFMERLSVYAYWPWGAPSPKFRKDEVPDIYRKKALIVTSSAAPGILARWFFGTTRQLKYTAKIIGADTIGILNTGLIAGSNHADLPDSTVRKIKKLIRKLL